MLRKGTRGTGDEGEHLAQEFLRTKGMDIVTTNYQYEHGEIDIIARDGEVLVFCEVKLRKSDTYGPPEYAITPRKQAQIKKIAEAYLYEFSIRDQICRFDVVAISMIDDKPEIRHYKNAF
jgi:putative endonuclease